MIRRAWCREMGGGSFMEEVSYNYLGELTGY